MDALAGGRGLAQSSSADWLRRGSIPRACATTDSRGPGKQYKDERGEQREQREKQKVRSRRQLAWRDVSGNSSVDNAASTRVLYATRHRVEHVETRQYESEEA